MVDKFDTEALSIGFEFQVYVFHVWRVYIWGVPLPASACRKLYIKNILNIECGLVVSYKGDY